MAVCLVCGRYDEVGLRAALSTGWVFLRCPECQRGIPFDIIAGHLIRKTPEPFIGGFCPDHWFRDSGICSYCKMKRGGMSQAPAYEPEGANAYYPQENQDAA